MTKTRRWAMISGGAAATAALLFSAVAHAAGGESHGGPPQADWGELGASIVNFGVYLALLVVLGRAPIRAFYAARRAGIVASIEASAKATADAERELQSTMAKIANLDAERAAILDEFRALGEEERRRIVTQAEHDAARIVRDAEAVAEREVRRAKEELEAKLVDQAIAKAHADLKAQLTALSHAKLIDSGIAAIRTAAH